MFKKELEIKNWLNQYQITNYELIENSEYAYVVNVNDSVDISNCQLKIIPVKFNEINGYFNCSVNKLESLEGCPEIIHGNFWCNNNQLKLLNYNPKKISQCFDYSYNQITSLKGFLSEINGYCYINNNNLESLEYSPKIIKGGFFCNNNELSIEGIKYLPNVINSNVISVFNNNKLGYLQNIIDFNLLKENIDKLLKIKEEKENLLNNMTKKDFKNTINKI